MTENILKQLEIVQKSINWIKETDSMKGAKGNAAYRNFVNIRRKLKKKHFALDGNPAAAIFGQSQVGKSYLIDALLSNHSNSFKIKDCNNKAYDFKKDINPPGGGSEATSLVSRFSASYKPINEKFPIKANLLSPADIVLVLCDSYYNDIRPSRENMLQISEIETIIDSLKEKYINESNVQNYFHEDDVIDIQDYVFENFSTKASNLPTKYFEEISLLISKVNPDNWIDLFSVLWNRNQKFSSLFINLINEFKKLNFSKTIYLPIESVLYKHGTLLDIVRIKELFEESRRLESDYRETTDLLILNGSNESILSFKKSYLCAITAELVFNIPSEIANEKFFLKEIDLLDFPGARARKTTPENEVEEKSMNDYLIRGKVAYLFNKYAITEKLNILLLCAKHEQPSERAMPELIAPLINRIIGDTPESREEFLNKSKVPPLFIIGTFFNVNLEFNLSRDNNKDNTSLLYRWEQRFNRSLAEELIDIKNYDWFKNWTKSQRNFQNIFLLRDFEHSTQIFDGYSHDNPLEIKIKDDPESYPNFREELRKSFIEYPFVKEHFNNPEESWDRAASINEDGTGLIIQKLTVVASNIAEARKDKNKRELVQLNITLLIELKKYYHDSDSDNMLQNAKSTAGKIQGYLDISFGKDPYFFGTMMREFMIPQSKVYDLFHKKINEIGRKDIVNMDKYSAIRMNVSNLNPNNTFEDNLELLKNHYEHTSSESCKEYFENEGIDLQELFFGNNDRVKNFSKVLAESLESYWFDEFMLQNKANLEKIFSSDGLVDIQDMLRLLFKKLKIVDLIEDSIKRHVQGYRNIDEVYEMISDICAEIINKFINSIGTDFYNESDFEDLRVANEKNSLGLSFDYQDLHYIENNHIEVADLIFNMDNLAELLNQNPLPKEAKRLPNYRNYIIWYNLLKVGFVSVCDIPNYDFKANNNLKQIIEESNLVKYK